MKNKLKKRDMKGLQKILVMLLLLPFICGCNESDDVAAIFTGKTWKLNFIALNGQHEMYDFWGNNTEEYKKSMEKLNMGGTYTIRFEGAAEGHIIQGAIDGKTITNSLEGRWSANGKNNNFNADVTGNQEDILAKNFLEGLNNATSYQGDTGNLYLLYKSGQQTFRMFFRAVK